MHEWGPADLIHGDTAGLLKSLSLLQSTTLWQIIHEMESQFSVFGYLKSIIVSLRSVNIIHIAAFVYLLYHIQLMVYNLFWHPLARFPGPFLCRASWIQQCYYEAVLNGKLLERLPDYHRKYGK